MKRFIISWLLVLMTAVSFLCAPLAFADDSQLFQACNTNAQTKQSAICQDRGTKTNPVNHYIKVAASIVAALTGLGAVILIIVSGLTLVSSGGNSEAVTNSRKRITNAIIGIVIVVLAWTIIIFLTNRLIKT